MRNLGGMCGFPTQVGCKWSEHDLMAGTQGEAAEAEAAIVAGL